jgi:hypothetical protein
MYYPTLSIALISVSVILPTLAFTAVGLRVKARRVKETPLNASDYIIFLACVGTYLTHLSNGMLNKTCSLYVSVSSSWG